MTNPHYTIKPLEWSDYSARGINGSLYVVGERKTGALLWIDLVQDGNAYAGEPEARAAAQDHHEQMLKQYLNEVK